MPTPNRGRSSVSASSRQVNWRFFIVSAIVIAVLGSGAIALQRWQVKRAAGSYLEHAASLEKKSDWVGAAGYVNRYLQLMPNDSEERIHLARTFVKGAVRPEQKQRAIELYYRALGSGTLSGERALRLEVGELLVANGRASEGVAEARRVIEIDKEEASKTSTVAVEDPIATKIKAIGLYRQFESGELAKVDQDSLEVVKSLSDAQKCLPGDQEVVVLLVEALRNSKLMAKEKWSIPAGAKATNTEKYIDEVLEELVNQNPGDAKAHLASFVYCSANQKGVVNKSSLEEALRLDSEDISVLLTAGQIAYREFERLEKSGVPRKDSIAYLNQGKELFQKVIDKNPTLAEPLPYLALGQIYVALGSPDDAIKTWEKGMVVARKAAAAFQANLADLWLEQGSLAKAEKAMQTIDEEAQLLSQSMTKESRLEIERDQELRRGIWRIKRSEPGMAISHLRKVGTLQKQIGGESQQGVRALLLLGSAHATMGEWNESALAFQRVALLMPKSAEANWMAAASWLSANQPAAAVEQAEIGVRLEPSSRGWFVLGTAALQQQLLLPASERVWGRCEQALAAASSRLSDGTLTEPWQLDFLEADYLVAKGMDSNSPDQGTLQAIDALRRSEAKYAQSKMLWASLPYIYQRLGQPADADRCIEKLQSFGSSETDATVAKVRLMTLRGEFASAESLITQWGANSPDDAKVATVRRELLNIKLAQHDLPAAHQLLIVESQATPNSVNTLRLLAEIDLQNRAFDQVTRWQELLKSCGRDGESHSYYFKARQLIARATSATDPLLVEAEAEIAKLSAAKPTWAETFAVTGELQQKRGLVNQAIQSFEKAIALGDQRFFVYEQLIALLEKSGRSAEVEKYVARLQSHIPFSQTMSGISGAVEVRRMQPTQALGIARERVQGKPNDALARLWLARLLMASGDLENAEKEFEKAVELQPEDVRTWNGKLSYYLKVGNKSKGQEVLVGLADKTTVSPAEKSFVLAQGYELLGDNELAAKYYLQASEAAPKNVSILLRRASFCLRSNPDIAQECLRSALKIEPTSAIAKHNLVALLASRGKEEDWQEVDRLLAGKNQEAVGNAQDNRLQAILLTRRGGEQNYARAIKILAELVSRPETRLVSDSLLLGQLYEKQARFIADSGEAEALLGLARTQFVELASKPDPQPAHVIALIEFLLRRGESTEAKEWLDRYAALLEKSPRPVPLLMAEYVRLRLMQGDTSTAATYLTKLEEVDPTSLITVGLRARVMAAEGKSGEIDSYTQNVADKLLQGEKPGVEPAEVFRSIGDLLTSLKLHAQAEKWFAKLYEAKPEMFQPLAMNYSQQGKISEALALCVKAKAESNPRGVLTVIAILSGNKASEHDLQTAEKMIQTALKNNPSDQALLFNVATLRVTQGKVDEAISHFEKVVGINDRHVPALNNLATLLSEIPERRPQALKLINQAIEITGSEPALFDTKGTILILDGKAAQAVEFLQAAVNGPDADPRFRFHLAWAYDHIQKAEEAKAELAISLKQDLEKQILTPTEQKTLSELRAALAL